MTAGRTCIDCSAPVTRQSKSGRCKSCAAKKVCAERTPEQRRAMAFKAMARDPGLKQRLRDHLRVSTRTPEHRERARKMILGRRLWESSPAHLPEARAKAGRTLSERRLSWCPPERRDEYRKLQRKIGSAAEARVIILAQHEREMTAFRRKCGEVPAPAPVDPSIIPEVIVDPEAPRHERILATAAAVFAIPREAIDRPSRVKTIVRARWAAMLALADEGLSLSKIAHAVGLSDHTTVAYAFSRATPLLANDPGFAERVEMVRAA